MEHKSNFEAKTKENLTENAARSTNTLDEVK